MANITYIDACIVCGHPAKHDETIRDQQLDRLLRADELKDLKPDLKSFGIYHDGHLELLQNLRADERLKIIRPIPDVASIDGFYLERLLSRGDLVEVRFLDADVPTILTSST